MKGCPSHAKGRRPLPVIPVQRSGERGPGRTPLTKAGSPIAFGARDDDREGSAPGEANLAVQITPFSASRSITRRWRAAYQAASGAVGWPSGPSMPFLACTSIPP